MNELGQQPNPTREYVADILQSDSRGDRHTPEEMQKLSSPDFALANINSADREYYRLHADNIGLLSEERKPPKFSPLKNQSIGTALYDDGNYKPSDEDQIESINREIALLSHHVRTSRSVGGWQQDKFSESIQTNRVEDAREPAEEENDGVLGLL